MSGTLLVGRVLLGTSRFRQANLHETLQFAFGKIRPWWPRQQERWLAGEGEGKGGGGGGSIRSAGGSFGKRQAAQEEQFFKDEESRQIQEFKAAMKTSLMAKRKDLESKLSKHKDHVVAHKEAITGGEDGGLHEMKIQQHEEIIKDIENALKEIDATWKKISL